MKVLAVFALVILAAFPAFAFADVIESNIPVGAVPSDPLLQLCICDCGRTLKISPDFLGNDAPTINLLNLRPSNYAFTGEQIEYVVIVRDPRGTLNIGATYITIDNSTEAVCNPINQLPATCDGLRVSGANSGKQPGQTDSRTDKTFHCLYTVEPLPEDSYQMGFLVRDVNNNLRKPLYTENWNFNPAISLSVTTTDGQPVSFESAQPGEFAHSVNRIEVTNTANAGVALWMFIAASDLFATGGASKCPTTNKIDVEGSSKDPTTGLYYRSVSGSLLTDVFTVPRPGDKIDEGWAHITNPNQNLECSFESVLLGGMCTGARPLFSDSFLQPGFPDALNGWAFNVLTANSRAEIEFKLKYPTPCIGSFTKGVISVLAKPV